MQIDFVKIINTLEIQKDIFDCNLLEPICEYNTDMEYFRVGYSCGNLAKAKMISVVSLKNTYCIQSLIENIAEYCIFELMKKDVL